jgi:hypothetical protein
MKRIKYIFGSISLEGVLWTIALLYLLFINPYEVQKFTLCPFHNMGIEYCPGCGLGRSISFLYHGDILHSIKTHPLGIAAFVLIILRIAQLTKQTIENFQQKKRGDSWQTSMN